MTYLPSFFIFYESKFIKIKRIHKGPHLHGKHSPMMTGHLCESRELAQEPSTVEVLHVVGMNSEQPVIVSFRHVYKLNMCYELDMCCGLKVCVPPRFVFEA